MLWNSGISHFMFVFVVLLLCIEKNLHRFYTFPRHLFSRYFTIFFLARRLGGITLFASRS